MAKNLLQDPSKWAIYNQITGEVYDIGLTKREADDKLSDMFHQEWRNCECIPMEDLLEIGFPYTKRGMVEGWYHASKEMVDAWTEFQRIGKEFSDTREREGIRAAYALKHHYNMEWAKKVGDEEAMIRYFLPYYKTHGEWPDAFYKRKWGGEINVLQYEETAKWWWKYNTRYVAEEL